MKLFGKKLQMAMAVCTMAAALVLGLGATTVRAEDGNAIPVAKKQLIKDGTYKIRTKLNKNFYLDVAGASKKNGGNVVINSTSKSKSQKFKITYLGDGYYRIVNANSGRVLNATGKKVYANVNQKKLNKKSKYQMWQIAKAKNGYYYLINKASGLFLDVDNANAISGTNVKMFIRNDAYNAQQWKFVKVK